MKQIKYIILSLILAFSLIEITNASLIEDTKTEVLKTVSIDDSKSKITRADSFNFFSEYYLLSLPKSYKYINIAYRDVKKWTQLYESMQKLVYIDVIENKNTKLVPWIEISAYWFYSFAEKVLWEKIIELNEVKKLKSNYASLIDLYVLRLLIDQKNDEKNIKVELNQKTIFEDVYNTIIQNHYNKETISSNDMMYSAIEWLAQWTKDKFTTYFPPVEKKQFSDTLAWEYEWIWAYVDMLKAWEFRIISPLSWSPAEKSWLKANDIIKKIDDFEITTDTTTDEAVSKIKWKAGTYVSLKILRWNETLIINVKREKIVLKDVEWKSLSDEIYYMNIRMFWDNVISDFETSLEDLKSKTKTQKLIIDLRNNPWGYLDSVSEILSYFVKSWENVAIVKYRNYTQNYKSKWYNDYDFTKLKIIILQNEWTASASEIMIGTLKDYLDNVTLLWEKTYGKWSVQTIKTYYDWSSLKYTIAKWFTWKTETGIDWIWIKADKELKFDEDKKKSWVDNQLEEAKKL